MSFILQILAVIFFASQAHAAGHTGDSVALVKENLSGEKAVLVDVREVNEWNQGHLQLALSVPLSTMRDGHGFNKLPKDKIIYLHCQSGRRVLPAAEAMRAAGFSDVRALPWGYPDLIKQGFKPAE